MIRFIIALAVGKIIKGCLKLSGRRATHFPGKAAVRICPDFLKLVAKPETVICVTGTNGKTSVCNMLEDCLRKSGLKVADNSYGSNTLAGICSSMLGGVSIFNKTKCDAVVLEVDERSSLHIYKYITPAYFVCTNLFRDSINRNAHAEYIFSMIDNFLPEESTLILNADDIISSRLGRGRNKNRVFFGVDRLRGEEEENNIINDGKTCPDCGEKMIYSFKRYHHIGRARCSSCSLSSPAPDYRVTKAENGVLTLSSYGEEHEYPLVSGTAFNMYNEAAVIAVLGEMGFEKDKIAACLEDIHITGTRYSEAFAGNVKIICTMLKGLNPVACSRNCHTVKTEEGSKAVFFMTCTPEYERESSEIIEWHYEADYEQLVDDSVKKIYISGKRALDIKYRLLLAGYPEERIVTGEREADIIPKIETDNIDTLFIFYNMFRYDLLENDVKPAIVERFNQALGKRCKTRDNRKI